MTGPRFDAGLVERVAPEPPAGVDLLRRVRRQAAALISAASGPDWAPLMAGGASPAVCARLAAIAEQVAACRLAVLAALDDLHAAPADGHRP